MRPAITVLQLDTHFPRIPGDVACPDSYCGDVEIVRIPAASVGRIVTEDPARIDISPFEVAVRQARGDVIATSCGFLAHWETHLQALSARPVIASALRDAPVLRSFGRNPAVLTFDAEKLSAGHSNLLAGAVDHVIGLHADMHLRRVIEQDASMLNEAKVASELATLLRDKLREPCDVLLLECTNLPPYKAAIRTVFNGRIVDILTIIERERPGTVHARYL